MFNSHVQIGRLVAAPYVSTSETKMAAFKLAIDRDLTKAKREELIAAGKSVADFINFKGFGKTAELVERFAKKGSLVAVEFALRSNSYQKDGKMVYEEYNEILSFRLLERIADAVPTEPAAPVAPPAPPAPAPAPVPVAPPAPVAPPVAAPVAAPAPAPVADDDDSDDLPF